MFSGNKTRACCNENFETKREKGNYSPGSYIYLLLYTSWKSIHLKLVWNYHLLKKICNEYEPHPHRNKAKVKGH